MKILANVTNDIGKFTLLNKIIASNPKLNIPISSADFRMKIFMWIFVD